MSSPVEQKQLLDTREAATFLALCPGTLEVWRVRGGGPTFVKLGRAVRYRRSDLEVYALDRLRCSTSDRGREVQQ